MTRIGIGLLMLLSLAGSAQAQSSGLSYTPSAAPAPFDPTTLLIKLFILTGFVVLICCGIIWWGRMRPSAAAATNSRLILEGSLPLDRRCTLHIVKADGQSVAITSDTSGLRSIVVLSESFEKVLNEAR